MTLGKIIGLSLIATAWLILVTYILAVVGFTLYNVMVCVISGVIIFVPLWKRYIKADKRR